MKRWNLAAEMVAGGWNVGSQMSDGPLFHYAVLLKYVSYAICMKAAQI